MKGLSPIFWVAKYTFSVYYEYKKIQYICRKMRVQLPSCVDRIAEYIRKLDKADMRNLTMKEVPFVG